eukprot:TRINITY_DN2935_c0_g1_i1.p1 TRINITY_DN2935_c0_g1~~TRINITY_DN2935_c0_g1_i1.p1  ORF type:complete len:217 (+),score=20.43 TRINITY_DN2935_c0_g1_i1:20-670(+)
MGDTNRRVSLLFASVGTAVLTTVFLHWYPKPKPTKRSLVASSSILDNGYDSEDFSDDIEHPVDQPVDHPSLIDNWKRPPTATDKYVSLYKGVKTLRVYTLGFLLLSLVANEISYLFCNGHTVLAYLLLKLSKQFKQNKKLHNAARLVSILALWWNKIWLSASNSLLKENYQELIHISQLLKNKEEARRYSKNLTSMKLNEKKQAINNIVQKVAKWL